MEITKDQPEKIVKKLALVLLLSVPVCAAPRKPSYTFDPQSIIKVEVESHACKIQGTSGHCKHAEITFGAVMSTQVMPVATPSARLVPAFVNAPTGYQVTYTFKPTDCKPLPLQKGSADALLGIRYTCKNVSWQ